MIKELGYRQLRKTYSLSASTWEAINKKKRKKPIIGQQRALNALNFGLGNKTQGFNIYVSGYPGSGKYTAVEHFLKERAIKDPTPSDWCYVHNFQDPYTPLTLKLPNGGSLTFKSDIATFIEEARQALMRAFESEEFSDKKQEILNRWKQKEGDLFSEANQKAIEEGFVLKHTPVEIVALPIVRGKPLDDESFKKLSLSQQKAVIQKQKMLKDKIRLVLRRSRDLDKSCNENIIALEKEVALFAIETLLDELRDKYMAQPKVLSYLDAIKNDILSNLRDFIRLENEKSPLGSSVQANIIYQVNALVDNSELQGAPIVLEHNPTLNNLFGKVEYESKLGTLVTDFTLIRRGSLHLANGGYLIIPVDELLRNLYSWECLKRALRNRCIEMEDISQRFGWLSTKGLRPDPIPLDVQIILIGNPRYYHLLYELDDDFKELFKVKAEFDVAMSNTKENIKDFSMVIKDICQEHDLKPLNKDGLVKVLEYAAREAGDQNKISTRFGEISDIIYEANHYAKQVDHPTITGHYIKKAVEEKYLRSNLIQDKINELIDQNIIMVDLKGQKTGQLNGISIHDLGDITFGRPNRITSTIGTGRHGIIDIEREAELGGKIHTKGVLILSGYLVEKYGQDKPVSLEARLVFEQSYREIEGDSASCAELCAILSNLSGVPLKQGIAVTGSINQKGEIQAVGKINEKIEGFFTVCKNKGLDGKQGVIIPKSNTSHLMLTEEVVEAVKAKEFHIWAISNINQGIEVLTDVKGGKQYDDGRFEKDSIHFLVNERLIKISENLQKHQPSLGPSLHIHGKIQSDEIS